MRTRRVMLSVCLLCLASAGAVAQTSVAEADAAPATRLDSTAFAKTNNRQAELRALLLAEPTATTGASAPIVRPVHRALFCRFDDQLDEKGIPLRMRLGSLEAVNQKEGKPGW